MALRHQLVREILKLRFEHYAVEMHDFLTDLKQKSTITTNNKIDCDKEIENRYPSETAKVTHSDHPHGKMMNYMFSAVALHDRANGMNVAQLKSEFGKEIIDRRNQVRVKSTLRYAAKDEEAFFNDLDADADYSIWSEKPFWTAREAAALMLEKNPKVVSYGAIEKYDLSKVSPFCCLYRELLSKIRRARSADQLKKHIPPSQFVSWAAENTIKVPEQLQQALHSRLIGGSHEKGVRTTSLQRIILVYAIEKHGYDPTKPFGGEYQNKVISGILGDCAAVGESINEDTLRSSLDEARAFLGRRIDDPVLRKARWKQVRKAGGSARVK